MTAGVDPQWWLDLVAPAQVSPSDAAIMRRTMELTPVWCPYRHGRGRGFAGWVVCERLVPSGLR
jgi:hypothetical protein